MIREPLTASRDCPRVSDHALLRYLERAKGVDVEAARAEILTTEHAMAIKAGAVGITIGRVYLPVRNGCVVTVIPVRGRPKTFARYKIRARARVRGTTP